VPLCGDDYRYDHTRTSKYHKYLNEYINTYTHFTAIC
jgi:hypothetical protein